MKSDYLDIFNVRGKAYDLAMREFPNARDEEFERLFDAVNRSGLRCVADVPAGGGYLQKFLPESQIDSLEPCEEFQTGTAHGMNVNLEDIQFPHDNYNLIISLAAIHHIDNKPGLFRTAFQALAPGGYLCIGDVQRGSNLCRFLDEFAGAHNGTGHHGLYLTQDAVTEHAKRTGFAIIDLKEKPCPWHFPDRASMARFCTLLFGLQNVTEAMMLEALDQYVGFRRHAAGISLNWRLLYACLQKT